ncbi:MAG: hypothetical protein H2212_03480 [Ruminococcus sp.]|nr:hypothetical protein [Ruminococcus sp.]
MISREDKEAFMETCKALYDIADKKEGTERKNEIMHGFFHGLSTEDVSIYTAPGFTGYQMQVIRVAIEEGIPKEYIRQEIAVPNLTVPQMLAAKAKYYREESQVDAVVPDIYIKGIEMAFEQLKAQTELSESFYRDTIQSLRSEKNALQEEIRELHLKGLYFTEVPNNKQGFQVSESASKSNLPQNREERKPGIGEKSQGNILSFLNPKKFGWKRPTWIIELICREAFDVNQSRELQRAYKVGIDKKDILKFANVEVPADKMRGIINMLMEIHQLEEPITDTPESSVEHRKEREQIWDQNSYDFHPAGSTEVYDDSADEFEEFTSFEEEGEDNGAEP